MPDFKTATDNFSETFTLEYNNLAWTSNPIVENSWSYFTLRRKLKLVKVFKKNSLITKLKVR